MFVGPWRKQKYFVPDRTTRSVRAYINNNVKQASDSSTTHCRCTRPCRNFVISWIEECARGTAEAGGNKQKVAPDRSWNFGMYVRSVSCLDRPDHILDHKHADDTYIHTSHIHHACILHICMPICSTSTTTRRSRTRATSGAEDRKKGPFSL